MRMMLGLDTPSSGSVHVNGRPYHDLTEPLRSVGALLDAKAIVGDRSAANHLKWLADTNGIKRRRVPEVLDRVGLSDVAGKRLGTFSLGMNQRLGIAAALLGDPDTVLLVIGRGRIIADASTEEFINGNAARRVRVRALEQTDLAVALAHRGAQVEPSADGAMVVTGLDSAAIGGVGATHGITLVELAAHGATLEEAFFELTRNETDYHASELAGATQRSLT